MKIGNLDISSIKVGSADCKVYLGDVKLYPTTFPGRWLATYTGGTTSSADCNASSSITQNQISKNNLVSVEIGECTKIIDRQAFANYTTLSSVTFSNSVTTINSMAFSGCTSLRTLDIPDSVTATTECCAFAHCEHLTDVKVGTGVTILPEYFFGECYDLTGVTLTDSLITLGRSVFYNCRSLTGITIPNSVTSIGQETFYHCTGLTSVTIPDSVTTISGDSTFQNCYGLTGLTIGSGITTINGRYIVSGCSSLQYIVVAALTPPTLASGAFDGTGCVIYVPNQSLSQYRSASVWRDYRARLQGYDPLYPPF